MLALTLLIIVIISFLLCHQEQLLLSVLPKHVADEMINDLSGTNAVGPFRKMYMNRYENVRSVIYCMY